MKSLFKHKLLWVQAALLPLLLLSSAAFAKNKIDSVRIWPSPDNTRVVLDLKKKPEYSYFTLSGPNRLVVDLRNTSQRFDLKKIKNSSKIISDIRTSNPKDRDSIRLVFDLNIKAEPNVFTLAPTAPYGNRLVIDLRDPNPKRVLQPVITSVEGERDILIAVDAGHGGEDPGSIGPSGTYEKKITMAIAEKLAKKINDTKGLRAVLTRTGDYYINVGKRSEIARDKKADLLISIHADAFTTPKPSGAAVWVLSMKRANSEIGQWMEKREKHSELLGGAAEVIQDTQNEKYLARALLDMSMDHSMATSHQVSQDVIKELKKITKMHKRTPQSASLGVLKSPDIPSILVETGFISNPSEEKRLKTNAHQYKLVNAIHNAVVTFFHRQPPDGTLFAKLRMESREHRVQRGDSLSLLAQRYRVKVQDIKRVNNMSTNVVRIGQVLKIPNS